tara:strand:+ start:168 stop:536 length:369 start_codon:yes stop_codon:yes gene_type:complete
MTESTDGKEVPAKPPTFDSRGERESSFWRLKRSSDRWRENRLKRVLAQEEETVLTTAGRMFYVTACLLFDGLVLTEIPVRLGKTPFSWMIFFLTLAVVVRFQKRAYENWFAVDITQIDFDRH